MKLRLVVAVALILLAVGWGAFCLLRLDRAADGMAAAIETAMAAADQQSPDWAPATEEIQRLWRRQRPFLHTLLPHVNLNELEWALGALPEYLEQGDRNLYIEQCVRALQCVNTLREMERPTLGNIF